MRSDGEEDGAVVWPLVVLAARWALLAYLLVGVGPVWWRAAFG